MLGSNILDHRHTLGEVIFVIILIDPHLRIPVLLAVALVVRPEVIIAIPFVLVACNFVKYGKIDRALSHRQFTHGFLKVELLDEARLSMIILAFNEALSCRTKTRCVEEVFLTISIYLSKLVFLEVRDQLALVLLQKDL